MALKWHPDKNPDNPEAEEVFKKMTNAYEYAARKLVGQSAALRSGAAQQVCRDASSVVTPLPTKHWLRNCTKK